MKEEVPYFRRQRRGHVEGGGTNHERREQKGSTDEIGKVCL
jgi:hypothetical protein